MYVGHTYYVLVRCAIINVCINCAIYSDADVDDHEHVSHQPSLVQQLTFELSQKKMIVSKNCIHLSKVVGQGLCMHSYTQPTKLIFTSVVYIGESGLVYCGYLDRGGARNMVAIKTCKGKENITFVIVHVDGSVTCCEYGYI